jgi:hypothetical protein
LNKYLKNGKGEIKVSINNSGENILLQNPTTIGELITAERALVDYSVFTFLVHSSKGRLEYDFRFIGSGGWCGRDSEQKIWM